MIEVRERILIIKHGAFGDLIQSLGPMAAIRAHHPRAHITLMTTQPFADFMRACPHIDDVFIDTRPRFINLPTLLRLRSWLKAQQFTRVYDLQNSDRSCVYFYLMLPGPRPEWVGTAIGASHRNQSPLRTAGLAFTGHVQTLALAGIKNIQIDRLEWVKTDLERFRLPENYALIVPGSSPQHPGKRWPATHYHDLVYHLIAHQITPIIIGGKNETNLAQEIAAGNNTVINLCGQTQMNDLPELARGAYIAIGNDTGPMHVFAATGCQTITLFDMQFSNPIRHQPLGAHSQAISVPDLAQLSPKRVIDQMQVVLRATAQATAVATHTAKF